MRLKIYPVLLLIYWKNGKLVHLQANTTKISGTNGIAVVVHPASI